MTSNTYWRDGDSPRPQVVGEKGEGELAVLVVLAVIGLAIYGGLNLFDRAKTSDAPKIITADGESYVGCRDGVSVKEEGGGLLSSAQSFEVSFTDASGLKHTLHGIHKVETSDIPPFVDAPMPYPLPSAIGVDSAGKPYKEGNIYTWVNGEKAKFRDGTWVPVKVPNEACSAK